MDDKKLKDFLMQETEFDHSVVKAMKGYQNVNDAMIKALKAQKIKTSMAIGIATISLGLSIFLAVRG